MLRQLRLCRVVDAVSLFRCRLSITQRHFLRACSSHRSVLFDSPVATAAKDPRWVMLNLHGRRMDKDNSFVADPSTVADCRTRFPGPQHLRVSLGGAAPPASSFLYYDFPDCVPEDDEDDDGDYDDISVDVVAAHSDSVLLRMGNKNYPSGDFDDNDYLVYRAGAAGPPSLSLLPDRDFLTKAETIIASCSVRPPVRPALYSQSTGLLRRGENDDDLVVVEVDLWYDRDARREMLEFCVLRTGADMHRWELMEPVPIVVDDDEEEVVPRLSSGNALIPVGDRYLCWVDYENGFFLCDMADEASPKVRYALLPAEVRRCCISGDYMVLDYNENDDVFRMKYSLKLGSAGASRVRLVSVSPHCCCGGPGRSTCEQGRFAFTVTTWTMDLGMDVVESSPLAWVKDEEMDCEEVWALPGYEGLPRANLECPVVSLDDPNVVCFLVSNRYFTTTYEDRKVWMIQLNMKSKTLLSVVQFSKDLWSAYAYYHLPAQLQY